MYLLFPLTFYFHKAVFKDYGFLFLLFCYSIKEVKNFYLYIQASI